MAFCNELAGTESLQLIFVPAPYLRCNPSVLSLQDGEIDAKKLAIGGKEKYIKLAKADFATTKELIDAIKPYESIKNKLSTQNETDALELAELVKLSGRDLYLQGKLERLKALSEPQFKLKYKEAFGLEYKSSFK